MPAAKTPDAIALLKADHKKVRGLLEQLEKSTEKSAARRTRLLSQIEEIFYPAYKNAVRSKDDRKLFFEAHEEHHVVKGVLPEIAATDPATEVFGAKAKVLKELVEHHAEEEEKEMFKSARKAMSAEELRDLGLRMAARKVELMGKGRSLRRAS
jgi:hemerythrin-like domain-containing protein